MVSKTSKCDSCASKRSKVGNVNNTEYMSVRSYFLFHSVRQLGLTPQLEHVQKSTCFLQTASIVQHY